MSDDRALELLTPDEQIRILRFFLLPWRSVLRPYLALFAIRNYFQRESGRSSWNRPTAQWYQRRLVKTGVYAKYYTVRYQLNKMTALGVLDKVRRRAGRSNVTKEYRLNQSVYPALEQALKQVIGVDTFDVIGKEGKD